MALMTITQFMTGIKNWVLGKIENITALIPSQASSSNKLADKAFVNSSIATATATFQGTYNVVSDLSLSYNATHAQIQTALATKMSALSITPDNNDYAFVQIPTSDATPTQIAKIEKYKYNGTAWAFEYELNNSGFTAAQWAAINSGATLELIGKLQALPTNAQLIALLENKVSWTDNGAYDVTAHNSGATFASFSALLNSENLNTLIPTDIRKGGMSIKFVQSSDNNYVRYNLKATSFSTNVNDWQEVEDVTTIVTPVNATDATLPITALTCEVGKYYRIDVAIDTLAVTLPAMTDLTTVRTVVIYLTAGTTPAVTIASADSKDVYYQDGFEIEAGNTYEINALFNGAAWIVAAVKINTSNS